MRPLLLELSLPVLFAAAFPRRGPAVRYEVVTIFAPVPGNLLLSPRTAAFVYWIQELLVNSMVALRSQCLQQSQSPLQGRHVFERNAVQG